MNARPDIHLDHDHYERVIANASGVIDISDSHVAGYRLWVVVEDGEDICSVGMNNAEIKALIAFLQKKLKDAR